MGVVEYSERDGAAWVEMNRPEKKNAQSLQMRRELVEALEEAGRRPSVRVVLISGRGDAFSTGHDLSEPAHVVADGTDPGGIGVYGAISRLNKPTIAVIHGACVAQGAGVALLCHLRVAAEDAWLAWPHVDRGLASVSGPVILTRLLPTNIALEYLFTAKRMTMNVASRWGLVNAVVAPEDLHSTADALARTIAGKAPLSVEAVCEISRVTGQLGLQEALLAGERMAQRLNASEDVHEGVAAFLEKRAPVWRGR